jgi:hypothetical protein
MVDNQSSIVPYQTGLEGDFQRLLNKARYYGPEYAQKISQAVQKNPSKIATLGTAGALGVGNLLQGDLLGAATSTIGGLAGGGIGTLAAGLLPKPLQAAGRFALPAIGSLIGGAAAEQGGAKAAEYLGANIPGAAEISERAQQERTRSFEREQQRLDYQAMSQAQLARDKEYASFILNQQIEKSKAMLPIQERMMRSQLINQQALNASNASLYQQMGRSAVMGKATLANIAETGATTRALVSQNPYAGSVLQAPSISFG